MEIFNNGENSGYEEIVSSGPSWWPEYLEMDAVYQYEGWLLDLMYSLTERVVKNLFPSQADDTTIKLMERLLRIEPDETATMEERRSVVCTYYSGAGHLSRSVILKMLQTYTGSDGEVYFDNDGTLIITYEKVAENDQGLKIIKNAIARRMPAHLAYDVRSVKNTDIVITAETGIEGYAEYPVSGNLNTGVYPEISTSIDDYEA